VVRVSWPVDVVRVWCGSLARRRSAGVVRVWCGCGAGLWPVNVVRGSGPQTAHPHALKTPRCARNRGPAGPPNRSAGVVRVSGPLSAHSHALKRLATLVLAAQEDRTT